MKSFALSARLANRSALLTLSAVLFAGSFFPATGAAQFSTPRSEPTPDRTVVRPPAGFHVAIVEFEDMECPQCGRANPILKAASANYHAPWIRHDFPLTQHIWSHQAAINARWFDIKSKKLGDDYRDAVFADQINIENLDGLRDFTEKFAKDHGNIALPFAVDPLGKLDALVMADSALGQRLGIDETPTIWVVTDNPAVAPVRVRDLNTLYTTLDQAFAQTKAELKPVGRPAKSAVKHVSHLAKH